MTQRCELCGGDSHPSPDTHADQFGLLCPGPEASQDEQDIYRALLAGAYLNLLTTEAENYANAIGERKRLWYDRKRSEVSQDELQADCDDRVAEIKKRPAMEQIEGILIDPPHLTVPGKVPTRPPLIQVHERDRTEPSDALLFLATKEDKEGS